MSSRISHRRSLLALIIGMIIVCEGCANSRAKKRFTALETSPAGSLAAGSLTAGPSRTDDRAPTDQIAYSQTSPFQVAAHSTGPEVERLPPPSHAEPIGPDRTMPRDATRLPSNFRDLNESDMLSVALTCSPVIRSLGVQIVDNPTAAATIYDPAISATDPFFGPQAALSEFDSVVSASVSTQNNDRVFNNAIVGGATEELVQDLVNFNSGWQKRSWSGGVWEVNGLTGYDNNNRLGNRFPNYWETQLEAGVRQPLLRGAGRRFNSIAGPNARPGFNFSNGVVIARLNDQISDADFEIRIRSFVNDLYTAYWELDRQYQNYDSVVEAKELAHRTWQSVLAKRRANVAGGEANKEAQSRAKYYAFERETRVALGGQRGQGGLYVAERQLRQLMGLPVSDGELLRPVAPSPDAKVVFDFDELSSRAMADRVELRRQSLRVQQQQLRLVASKNFLLPQMDLIGRYRLRGFGDDLAGSGERFASAYQDFFSFDHQEWEFGLEMGMTVGRRQARAAVRNAGLQVKREVAILEEQQRVVRHELADAIAEVASSFATMRSSSAQTDAARARLESSQALFAADKIQLEFLLDSQEELLRAEVQSATDRSRYALALVNVSHVAGSLLNDLGIVMAKSGDTTVPLY